jgi:hypothetical protein
MPTISLPEISTGYNLQRSCRVEPRFYSRSRRTNHSVSHLTCDNHYVLIERVAGV